MELAAIADALKKAWGAVKKGLEAKKYATEANNHRGVVIGVLLLLVMLPVLAYMVLLATPLSIVSSITHYVTDVHTYFTEEELEAIVSDAGSLCNLLLMPGYEPYEEELVFIDKRTLVRILQAVDEYNDAVTREYEISYEYRIEKAPEGTLPEISGITGEVGEAEGTEYEVSYGTRSVTLAREDIDNLRQAGGRYEDIFYLNWQPVVTLCSLYIQCNVFDWGSYEEVDANGASIYYLSDTEIDGIIDVFSYTYVCKQNEQLNRDTVADLFAVSFDSFMESGGRCFRTRYYTVSEEVDGESWDVRETERIPNFAPAKIYNSYITYEYHYENVEDGRYLTSRSCRVEPAKLVAEMEEIVGGFYTSWFLYVLKNMPYSEDLHSYYKNVAFADAGDMVVYEYEADQISECPVIGVYMYGNGSAGLSGAFTGDYFDFTASEDDIVIRLYAGNGSGGRYIRPGEWIIEEGNDYGSFVVSAAALEPLTESDNLSMLHIVTMLSTFNFSERDRSSPLLQPGAVWEFAECLYQYQQDTGTSICGLLAIMKQEGGFGSTIATRGWNFFNISVGSQTTYGGIEGYERFRDYRSVFEGAEGTYESDAVNALEAQIHWINNNYWSNQHSQNTYYRMCFLGYKEDDPENAYDGIYHSYCPPWDDTAMPYSQDSYIVYNGENKYYWRNAGEGNRGWVNGCAALRTRFRSCAVLTQEAPQMAIPPGIAIPPGMVIPPVMSE